MLIASEKAYLVLDASHTTIQCGIVQNGTWIAYYKEAKPALEALPAMLAQLLKSCSLSTIGGFIYCMGPGSTLGLRIVLTCINTWHALPELSAISIYQYTSLSVAAALLEIEGPFTLIAPSRQGYYHNITSSADQPYHYTPIVEVSAEVLESFLYPIYLLPQAKLWKTNLHRPVSEVDYDLAALPGLFCKASHFFTKTTAPSLFTYTGMPSPFIPWKAERHRAP